MNVLEKIDDYFTDEMLFALIIIINILSVLVAFATLFVQIGWLDFLF